MSETNQTEKKENGWSFSSLFDKFLSFFPGLKSESYFKDLGPMEIINGEEGKYKKTLVLDLDETLICQTFSKVSDYDLDVEFTYNFTPFHSFIYKRPGLDEFLEYVKEKFDVVLFTAAPKCIAEPIINGIANWIPISHRFYRNDCLRKGPLFIKDLSRFNRPLDSIIIIDDRPESSTFHTENSIRISSYNGSKSDRELMEKVKPKLEQLETASDVRDVIRSWKNI